MNLILLSDQAALPQGAIEGPWQGASWRTGVKRATTPLELRERLGELEGAIRDGALSPAFIRKPLLVKGAWLSTGNAVGVLKGEGKGFAL